MASSRNKSNSTGLRILWIPGRKRHNRKGRYESTNKNFDSYSTRYGGGSRGHHKQGKNEMWSFGGSKGHEELIKTDISVDGGGHTTVDSSAVAQILPATYAVGLSLQSGNDDTKMRLEDEPNKFKILSTVYGDDMKKNSTAADVTIQQQQQQVSDQTQIAPDDVGDSAKASYFNESKIQMESISQDNINSIQQIEKGDLLKNSLSSSSINDKPIATTNLVPDVPDSTFQNYTTADNIKRNRNSKKKKKRHNQNRNHENDDSISHGSSMNGTTIAVEDQHQQQKEKDEDDAAVKCLYYTLMCCECSIS